MPANKESGQKKRYPQLHLVVVPLRTIERMQKGVPKLWYFSLQQLFSRVKISGFLQERLLKSQKDLSMIVIYFVFVVIQLLVWFDKVNVTSPE